MARGGHGRKRKLFALDRFEEKEANVRQTYNHNLSREVIIWCKNNNVGIIRMEKLTGIHDRIENPWLKRNWNYYQLQQMIKYKAENIGILVEFIDARYTSQTCSSCGHVDRNNRLTQAEFKCISCGMEIHADYNAALNISRRGSMDGKQPISRLDGEGGEDSPLSHSPDTTQKATERKVSGKRKLRTGKISNCVDGCCNL